MNQLARELKKAFEKNEAVCHRVIGVFHLLSNKGRFRIVCLLARGEFCVHDIAEVVGGGNLSNISQQLKMLALSDVIERRREHQHILYRLKDQRIGSLVAFLQRQFVKGKTK
jgi:DNA-binding transcriptional ArsR family regulator